MRKFKAVILAMAIMAICASSAAAALLADSCNPDKGAIYNNSGTITFGTFAVPSITKTVYADMLNMFAGNGCTTMLDELMEVFATMNLNP